MDHFSATHQHNSRNSALISTTITRCNVKQSKTYPHFSSTVYFQHQWLIRQKHISSPSHLSCTENPHPSSYLVPPPASKQHLFPSLSSPSTASPFSIQVFSFTENIHSFLCSSSSLSFLKTLLSLPDEEKEKEGMQW